MARRMITCDAVDSLYRHEYFKRGPNGLTTVEQCAMGSTLKLHGNPIAFLEYSFKGGRLFVCDGGWESRTTKERLNGLPGVSVHHAKHVFYLNGKEWNGAWALTNAPVWGNWTYTHPGFVIAGDRYKGAQHYARAKV